MEDLRSESPWHAGELAIQSSIGMVERMEAVGRKVVREYMPDQHREFFEQLPFAVFGAVDAQGDVWATLRAGEEGFLHSPDPQHLLAALPRVAGDPADAGMEHGASIGMLGIELHTRRRNRLNGTLLRHEGDAAEIVVDESYGNCPKYIHVRDYRFERTPDEPSSLPLVNSTRLDAMARQLISEAGTFFVATYADEGRHRVDVSHRGGMPGFVHIAEDGTLTVPDYQGNRFFNTLGNIVLNGKAGLVFPDFASGGLLQMTGDAEVLLNSPEQGQFEGAERLWRFRPRRIVWREDALPLRWANRA
ncbi:pyridoxamine 5'-phosphate oxidase family protein [Pseudoduganella sp. RAF53_2]|uniref:pyridoxamine 5'-phosphate oxidase family protein n=1 Tax=unclassified Pseudoduganella TaxID=2637179 RepID=UPI003F98D3FD